MKARTTIPLLLALATASEAGAQENGAPKAVVRSLLDAIKRVDAGEKKAEAEALALIDVQNLSEFGLGKHWQGLTQKQRKDFVALLSQLLAVRAFSKAGSFFEGLEVSYDDVSQKKDESTVTTSVVSPEEGKVVVAYRLRRAEGRWLVFDVILDGVSLRTNIRAQFQKIIAAESYDELLRRMREKLEEESE